MLERDILRSHALHGHRALSQPRRPGCVPPVSLRGASGAGWADVGSWVEASLGRCFQVMECDDVRLLQQWVSRWSDLVDFEIVAVVTGADTAEALGPLL
jgi:hypothetical protein